MRPVRVADLISTLLSSCPPLARSTAMEMPDNLTNGENEQTQGHYLFCIFIVSPLSACDSGRLTLKQPVLSIKWLVLQATNAQQSLSRLRVYLQFFIFFFKPEHQRPEFVTTNGDRSTELAFILYINIWISSITTGACSF